MTATLAGHSRFVIVIACWAASIGVAGAEPITTIRNSGPSANRVDLVIMGDGFTASQIASGEYAAQIQVQAQRLFAQEPYLEYGAFFNVHRIDVTSAQAGADHPERGVFVDTALNATYNCGFPVPIQRLICVSTANVNAVLARTALPLDARDIILVIVNDTEYGGSGGAVAVASLHRDATELVLHENGHTFAQLADEYNYSPPACVTSEPGNANATRETRRDFAKWRHWIDPATPVPTGGSANGVPGLYEGAVYCTSGAYRPTFDSKMRSLGRPFEQINTEQHIRRIYNLVSPLDSWSPTAAALTVIRGVPNYFSVAVPAPRTHALSVNWFVDGVLTGTGLEFSSDVMLLGAHRLEARVQDTTGLVRNDPTGLLLETHAWDVTVQDGPTSVPTFLRVASIAGNTVTLAWSAPTTFAPTGYVLEGGVVPHEVLASIPTGSASPTFTFTAPTGAFYVRIHALNGADSIGCVERDPHLRGRARPALDTDQPPGCRLGLDDRARVGERQPWRRTRQHRPRRQRRAVDVAGAAGHRELHLRGRAAGHVYADGTGSERCRQQPALPSGDLDVPGVVRHRRDADQPGRHPHGQSGDRYLEPAAEWTSTIRLRAGGLRRVRRHVPDRDAVVERRGRTRHLRPDHRLDQPVRFELAERDRERHGPLTAGRISGPHSGFT